MIRPACEVVHRFFPWSNLCCMGHRILLSSAVCKYKNANNTESQLCADEKTILLSLGILWKDSCKAEISDSEHPFANKLNTINKFLLDMSEYFQTNVSNLRYHNWQGMNLWLSGWWCPDMGGTWYLKNQLNQLKTINSTFQNSQDDYFVIMKQHIAI